MEEVAAQDSQQQQQQPTIVTIRDNEEQAGVSSQWLSVWLMEIEEQQQQQQQPHYENDIERLESETSDEEGDIINTVGNVPIEWYRFHDHIGYDKSGEKVKQLHKSNIDELVDRVGNPNAWRTIKDIYNGREIEIDLDTIIAAKRMVANHLGSDDLMKQIQISPENNVLKEDFLSQQKQKPSEQSLKQTGNSQTKVALRIMRNWMEHKLRGNDLSRKRNNRFYDLWSVDTKLPGYVRRRKTMPPPPSFKPGHCESYNPPEEYLFSDKEVEQWNNNHPALRTAFSCIPQKSDSLCYIKNDPNGYLDFVSTRCENLFSCPRISVNRMPDDLRSTDLLPKIKLPTIANSINLKEKIKFIGHKGYVKHLAMHRNSIHMASASHDKTIRIWNVRTGRCIDSFSVCSQISQICWLPLDNFSVLSYSYDRTIVIKAIDLSANASIKSNNKLYFAKPSNISNEPYEMPSGYAFENISDNSLEISHPETIKTFNFHSKGNYISVVFKKPKNSPAVCIHNIKKQQTQVPFKKLKGIVINALFHPIKPIFFVISETLIKSFHLSNLENLVKIEIPSTKAVSSSLHKSGNHLIVGCDNGKVMWFDLELTIKPLRILNCHSEIVTDVDFHLTSDLFCSASEDGSTVVYDGKVFSDLMKNPEIMPIKKISAHSKTANEPGVTCVTFTSKLDNIISGGHDKLIRLFA